MKILIVAEHDNQTLSSATLNTLTAALQLGGEIDVLLAGFNCTEVADALTKLPGIQRVRLADNTVYEHQLSENLAELLASIANDYTHILAPAGSFGKDLMPRVAALSDVGLLADITGIMSEDTFKRPIYAGNAIATVQSSDTIKLMTVRSTAFDACAESGGQAVIESLDTVFTAKHTRFISAELAESDRPELTSAPVVVSGGRGVGSAEQFSLIYALADKLGAAVGASRAAVDAGYVPNDMQVGQTGKVVAPQLYIAVGISGAIQHLAGMKDSGVIVAINKDAEAPIFQVADYGLVADLFEAVPELTAKL